LPKKAAQVRPGRQDRVRGTTSDNGQVAKGLVNSQPAKATRPNFAEWEETFRDIRAGELKLTAHAVDVAGNCESRPLS
jgi:hypothetical protein